MNFPGRNRPRDIHQVELNESWEVQFWTKELDATEDQLRDAVQAVGPIVEAVRVYLRRG